MARRASEVRGGVRGARRGSPATAALATDAWRPAGGVGGSWEGAGGVQCAHRGPLGGEPVGQLADGGGLAAAVDADDHDHVGAGLVRQVQLRAAAPGLQQRLQRDLRVARGTSHDVLRRLRLTYEVNAPADEQMVTEGRFQAKADAQGDVRGERKVADSCDESDCPTKENYFYVYRICD